MIEQDAVHLGLQPIDRPLVPWRELRPLRGNALRRAILQHRDARRLAVLRDELDRFLQADEHFFLAAARTLVGMKHALWLDAQDSDAGLSPPQAARARACQRYFAHDCFSLLIHARIVCDRALPALRLAESTLQISLTSFHDHRRKLMSGAALPERLARWVEYVRTRTEWFRLVKDLRDDFLVHQGPRHMLSFGQRSDHDIEVVVIIPTDPSGPRPLADIRALTLSPRALVVCVTEFLEEIARVLPSPV